MLPREYFKEIAMMTAAVDTESIFSLVESHMGQWSKPEKIPTTIGQKIVHYADYLASRKEQPIIDFKTVLQSLETYAEGCDQV